MTSQPVTSQPVTHRPVQRAGHIGYRDNRFCGHSVFGELAATTRDPIDLLLLAFGLHVPDGDRELIRAVALAVCSPDARVWPLKLARTLASYGDPVVGYVGSQLVNTGDKMGPGTATHACASLAWIAQQVGPEPDDAAVEAAVARHLDERGRLAGFGVPFRDEDERLVALRPWLARHPATRRPTWRLALQVERVLRARGVRPNIVLAVAAIFLDLGLPPRRAGMLLGALMAPGFAAHALEAADTDGPLLRELPAAALDYQGAAPRRSPAEAARVATRTAGSSAPARRSLAW